MAEYITIIKDDEEYTLEFNRMAVIKMENEGFNILDAQNKPMSTVDTLIKGALIKNHRYMKPKEKDDFVEYMLETYGMNNCLDAIIELYQAVFHLAESEETTENPLKVQKKPTVNIPLREV